MPYKWKVVQIYKGQAKKMLILEKKLQKSNVDFKYIPKIKFSGVHECFKTLTII